jgi:hypothetical protein
LDNPTTESTITAETGRDVFAAYLDPQEPPKEEPDTELEPVAETAEPEAEPEEEDDPTVTVKIDGKAVEVKLSELKNGYQRQADYTRKTQEVSEVRRAAEAEFVKAQQERQTYAQNLQRLQIQTEAALQQQQTTDWQALLETDPVEYLKQQRIAQEQQARLSQVYAEQQRVQQQDAYEAEQRQAQHLQDQREQLLAKIPSWKDETKAKAEKAALRDFLLNEGYDEKTVASLADSRAVVIAREAMLYRQMVAKASAAAKKVSTLPTRVERPGVGDNPGMDKRSTAFQKLSRSGRVEDAAAVFANLL